MADLLKLYLAEKEKNTKLSIRRFHEGQRIKAMVDGTTASLPCRASLYNAYKMHRDGLPLRPRGKAGLLTDPETTELLKRLRDFEIKYCVMTNSVICLEAVDIYLRRFGDLTKVTDSSEVWWEIKAGLKTIFDYNNFVYNLRKKYVKSTKTSRGMEYFRARKYQPEIIVNWFRLVLHAYSLRIIQIALAQEMKSQGLGDPKRVRF